MALRISTTGSDVFLTDLGVNIPHPTNNRDLSLEFTAIELKESSDLTQAIQNGDLTVDDGTHSIASVDYDSDQQLIQDLGFWNDQNVISHDELKSKGEIEIVSGIFPLSLNSTASVTRNIYANGGKWITWWLDEDDIVEIADCSASGTYTVESVSDQQNFIVKESIVDSTGGNITIYHPGGASKIGVNTSTFDVLSGDTVQDLLSDIDQRFTSSGFQDKFVKVSSNDTTADYLLEKIVAVSGIQLIELDDGSDETIEISISGITGEVLDPNRHRDLDQLVHLVAEDSYEEFTYTSGRVTNATIWTDSDKTTKIREEQYTYTGNLITQIISIQYDESGVEVERNVETITRLGSNVTSITMEVT